MNALAAAHPWSEEALYSKALFYVGLMEANSADKHKFGLFSALSLEFLTRAALSHIHPVLLADNESWRNITHALGWAPTTKKFSPKSIKTADVLIRLSELSSKFTKEVSDFCSIHIGRRNAELHTGELAFDTLGTSQWLPKFYLACTVLLELMNRKLEAFISDDTTAVEMIKSINDAAAKAVHQDIHASAKAWENKSEEERKEASDQSVAWAIKQLGHRVTCPSCKNTALVRGNPTGKVSTEVDGEEVLQRQSMIPSTFECIACGLRISGLPKLSASGLGDVFIAKSTFSAADFFGLYTEDDIEEARRTEPEYEEDFNEYE